MMFKIITNILNDRQLTTPIRCRRCWVLRLPFNGSIVQSGKTDSEHFSCEARLKNRSDCERAQPLMASPERVRSGKLWRCLPFWRYSLWPFPAGMQRSCEIPDAAYAWGCSCRQRTEPGSCEPCGSAHIASAQSFEPSFYLRRSYRPARNTFPTRRP